VVIFWQIPYVAGMRLVFLFRTLGAVASSSGFDFRLAALQTCVDKHNLPMPNGASVYGHIHVSQNVQWLWTIRNENAFETLSVILSSLAQQHDNLTKVWLPLMHPNMIQPTGKDHVRNISLHFRKHTWRGGEPVGTSPMFKTRPVVACYDSARAVGSFDFMLRFAGEPALRAVASFQAASAHWFGGLPRPPAALVRGGANESAAQSPRVAVLLQRWPTARIVTNSEVHSTNCTRFTPSSPARAYFTQPPHTACALAALAARMGRTLDRPREGATERAHRAAPSRLPHDNDTRRRHDQPGT